MQLKKVPRPLSQHGEFLTLLYEMVVGGTYVHKMNNAIIAFRKAELGVFMGYQNLAFFNFCSSSCQQWRTFAEHLPNIANIFVYVRPFEIEHCEHSVTFQPSALKLGREEGEGKHYMTTQKVYIVLLRIY